jgi:hypothetical protein
MPPAGKPAPNATASDWFPAAASRPTSGTPYGVSASGRSGQPFGGPAAPTTYGAEPGTAVPHQRVHGTVYGQPGAGSPIDMTMPVTMNSIETSGSLTGHILSQGWDYGPDNNRRSNTKVAIAMLIVLILLVGVSLLFVLTAGSAFTDMFHKVFKG